MIVLILLIALAIIPEPSQSSSNSAPAIDLSGSWHDDSHKDRAWKISQSGTDITITSADGSTTVRGTLNGRVIKYTEKTILGEASSAVCQPYVGQAFEFPATFKVSKDANRIERKAPDSVAKGQCKLNLTKMPSFILIKNP